jgi:hypothetical protein
MVNAATNGHFDVILYLEDKGMARVTERTVSAADGGHFEIIRWIFRSYRAHMDWWPKFLVANIHNHSFCAQWLDANGLYDALPRRENVFRHRR